MRALVGRAIHTKERCQPLFPNRRFSGTPSNLMEPSFSDGNLRPPRRAPKLPPTRSARLRRFRRRQRRELRHVGPQLPTQAAPDGDRARGPELGHVGLWETNGRPKRVRNAQRKSEHAAQRRLST